ncbi:MAG TPA: hypothetical protein VGI83_09555, partial [Gemmatimonadales bacterium]
MKRHLLSLAAAALVLACSDTADPQDAFGGLFVLQSVDGATLPTTVSGNEQFPAYTIVADTLLITASGHFDDEPIPQTGQQIGLQGTWEFRGDSIFLFESTLGSL